MGALTFLRAQWDRALGVGLMVLGGLAVLIGWIGVSGSVYPAEQLPYVMSGGLGGLFLLGAGATFWLSADLRDEWRHLDALETDVESRLSARLEEMVAEAVGTAERAGAVKSKRS